MNIFEQNRAIIEAFVDEFYKQKNVRKAFENFVSEQYIQHNPTICDGREAAIEMLEPKFSNPDANFDIKRILVDNDLAVIHLNGKLSANSLGVAVVDIYRLLDGKIVEHWDVLQPVPTEKINPRSMF
jgi:predicted SnoaL-like aldol condensation-catalyzing enzyme